MELSYFIIALVTLLVVDKTSARKQAPPIGADELPRKSKAAECQFGRQVRELGSTWFADLGPPFGVMYCIRCECIPIQKKRRVVGKVHCRNIKHECPKPSCDEPILYPGRCCKICPQDLTNPEFAQDVAPPPAPEEEEKNLKYFAALLTGRTTKELEGGPPGPRPDLVATGRFAFHRRSLYFSFYASSRPRGIQFLDLKGNILEEQVLSEWSVYQNATGKVCGVWRRIPREYRRLIREEKLVVSLLWERADLAVSGQLYRYRTLSTEMFSSILTGGLPGSGGTAIVSVSTQAPSIHMTLLFNGVFLPSETSEVPISIKLHTHDKQTLVIDEVVKVVKPSSELNMVEVSAAVTAGELRLLSRHRLTVTLTNKADASLRLSGPVVTKVACELHEALVAPHKDADIGSGTNNPAVAAAWAFVDQRGDVRYFTRLNSLPQPAVIALVVERRTLELEDLTPTVIGHWSNGTLERVSPRHLEQLYSGELAINIATADSPSVAKGRLVSRHVADARDSPAPSLMLPTVEAPSKSLVAMAWSAVDNECNLHYDVWMSGPGVEYGDFELYISEVPLVAPGAPVSRRLLEKFSGSVLEGSALALLPGDLARIEAGMVHLEIQDAKSRITTLRASWHKMSVPSGCMPHYSDNDVGVQAMEESSADTRTPPSCYHGSMFHPDGSQWVAESDPCLVCHCSLGVPRCDPIVCPPRPANCIEAPSSPNQCCPSCANVTMNELGSKEVDKNGSPGGCMMAGHFHKPGSTWHPYLPPSGFDTCTHCTCSVGSHKVSCRREECPKLECDERTAIRPTRKACCKVCPAVGQNSAHHQVPHGLQGDQENSDNGAEILAQGGCSYPVGGPYPNGHEWHPRLYSHGEIKCITCRCKDGNVSCARKKCTKWSCNDECCSTQCSRGRRHAYARSRH